jgi:hypothetical protein
MTDATELAALADRLEADAKDLASECGLALSSLSETDLRSLLTEAATELRALASRDGADPAYWREMLRAANARADAAEGGGWLPIESAPRDETRILLYCNWIGVVRGSWNNDRHAKKPRPYWTNDTEHTFGKLRIRECQPYYWQPLPPPPAKAAPLPGAVGGSGV